LVSIVFIQVHDIRKSNGLSKSFDFEGPLALEGITLIGPLKANLRVTNAGERVLVEGELSGQMEVVCTRCAEPFAYPFHTEVEEYFIPAGSDEAEILEAKDPGEVFVLEDERIQIDELLRQEILAALPIQIRCKRDCKGLCAGCGADLNKEACSCKGEDEDPRWAALGALNQKPYPN
jgi:uncharacterized protein